jgi:hypothetical protein
VANPAEDACRALQWSAYKAFVLIFLEDVLFNDIVMKHPIEKEAAWSLER